MYVVASSNADRHLQDITPILAQGGPASYKWIVGPCALYVFERIYRLYKSLTRKLQILKVCPASH